MQYYVVQQEHARERPTTVPTTATVAAAVAMAYGAFLGGVAIGRSRGRQRWKKSAWAWGGGWMEKGKGGVQKQPLGEGGRGIPRAVQRRGGEVPRRMTKELEEGGENVSLYPERL